ncbi:MAG TPA: DNA primase [Paracoccus sp. (in: a-proteobacteria)]|uniref:DNA primase n=1 Tax=uncultured Paracoccus sp. TaxID=189685 RepID=UPI0026062F1F|nr:DNA primase [uncultured Paracoccus sp.]HMQ42367.1 DNA primase [Paracoccus sp. (in: a-proteobacteria)]HMR37445.1 DNA primase [Paracoccus sp. (in: a-proteobacteria)]
MSISPAFLDELRNRVPVSRIIGRKVTWDLRRSNQAKGDWWAPCPFHGEKTASFHVDDQKGFYYCFGCHAKGDALTFLRESDGLDFIEAVKVLAAEAGLPMPERDPGEARRADRRSTLAEAMEAATRHYRMALSSGQGTEARDYLTRRGLEAGGIERFELGFAPDMRQGLFTALREKGIPPEVMDEAGLVIVPDDGGAPYDRFRGRIIFPIRDARGRVIAFGGRAMDPNARAKYLNSPETALFDKGRNLYNTGPARAAVSKGAPLVVAEGYMDVIALSLAGFEGAVAPLGTAITEDQLRLMWRISPEPVIMLDGDAAGQRAARRLIDLALPMTGPGQALRFATLPAGQDPDDLIRAHGAGALQKVLDGARPLVDLLWEREVEGRAFDSPERRAALDASLRKSIALIPDETTRNHYIAALKERRFELFGGRRGAGRLTPGPRDWKGRAAPAPVRAQTRATPLGQQDAGDATLESMVLALCAAYPGVAARMESRLELLAPVDPGRAALCHDLLSGQDSQMGRAALARIMEDAYVRASPLIRQPIDTEKAAAVLANILDKIEARRAALAELTRAEAEIQGLVDEGLTWRVSEAARARHRAEHPEIEDSSDLNEDRGALSARLASYFDTRRSRGGG